MNEADTCRKHIVPLLQAAVQKGPAAKLLPSTCNLDGKNLHAKEDIAHLPPEHIAASIQEQEQRIAEIMGRIEKLRALSGES